MPGDAKKRLDDGLTHMAATLVGGNHDVFDVGTRLSTMDKLWFDEHSPTTNDSVVSAPVCHNHKGVAALLHLIKDLAKDVPGSAADS